MRWRASPPLFRSCISSACCAATTCCARCAGDRCISRRRRGVPPAMVEFFAARVAVMKELTLRVLFTCTFLIVLSRFAAGLQHWSAAIRGVFHRWCLASSSSPLLLFHTAFDSGCWRPRDGVFLWITVGNLFAVAVFWSFMATLRQRRARRFLRLHRLAGTLGAPGPMLTRFCWWNRIGIANLMLVSAGFLLLCIGCLLRLRRYAVQREPARQLASGEVPMGGFTGAGRPAAGGAQAAAALDGGADGVRGRRRHPAVQRAGGDHSPVLPDPGAPPRFYANIDLTVNGLTLFVQLLVTQTPLLSPSASARAVIQACRRSSPAMPRWQLPLPLLVAVVRVVTRASGSRWPSPRAQTVYTRVAREWRLKTGAAIDTVIYRSGDLAFVWIQAAVGLRVRRCSA